MIAFGVVGIVLGLLATFDIAGFTHRWRRSIERAKARRLYPFVPPMWLFRAIGVVWIVIGVALIASAG